MYTGRVKDLATLLPWVGLFLFTPPILLLFRPTTTIFGIPLLPVYLFTMWFVLIILAQKMTKHLVDEDPPPRSFKQGESKRSIVTSKDGA